MEDKKPCLQNANNFETCEIYTHNESYFEKTNIFAYAKTKTQIRFSLTAKLISAMFWLHG